MAVFIANCTRQNLLHWYRMPETNQLLHIRIDSGQQEKMGDRWTDGEQTYFVEQLERRGFRNFKDIKGKVEDFAGWLYSTDKPIKEDQYHVAFEKVIENANERAVQEVQKGALGLERGSRDQKSGRRLVKEVFTEITGDSVINGKPTDNDVSFTMSVSPDGHDTPKIKGLK